MEEVIGSIPLGSTILPFENDDTMRGPVSAPLRLAAGLVTAVLVPVAVCAQTPSDAAIAPSPAAALVADLRARILDAHSATAALESWCAEQHLSEEARLVALRLPVADKPPTAAQRARLGIGPEEPVRYRRVRLACGARVLSEADNWYVPARLTPAMNAALDGTRTPFGRVVRPLAPVRRTLVVRAIPPAQVPTADTPLFEVEAVLTNAAGEPFCEVAETYLAGALPGTPGPAPR